jgi:hypothetical protein
MSDKIELFYAPTSPYVRKVIACAIELGIADRIVRLPSAAHPLKRDERIAAFNIATDRDIRRNATICATRRPMAAVA